MDSSSDDERRAFFFRCFATNCIQWWEDGQEKAEFSRRRTRHQRLKWDRAAAHASLLNDYFNNPCVYTPEDFRNRFRMSRPLFLCILADVEREVPWFTQRFDARGRRGFSSVQNSTAALRQLAYGTASDMFDEYLKMSARSIRSCVYKSPVIPSLPSCSKLLLRMTCGFGMLFSVSRARTTTSTFSINRLFLTIGLIRPHRTSLLSLEGRFTSVDIIWPMEYIQIIPRLSNPSPNQWVLNARRTKKLKRRREKILNELLGS
ncbi:hypothetical protein DM860_005206 [Cuscuta australis]|uniref:Uncharacterized protein n=1 Tax=Cuscuta australis TaxID=267555 RepID=A0A328DMM9_9ASTE|nr:hypothetical protein DM860_005206 [Cuscuta australis]